MEQREFGKTGVKLSVVGLGAIALTNETEADSRRIVSEAIERGINYFDTGPAYGNAEELMGPALKPYRDKVFLACKTGQRMAEESWNELQRSLQRLKTDHVDLYQLHGISNMEDVEKVTGPGGALETFQKAQREGMTRFLGFSAHSEEAALALIDLYDFESVLFPFNWACWFKNDFGKRIVAKAEKKGVARLALKTLAERLRKEGDAEPKPWPKCWYYPVESREEAQLAVRFTLSLPITAAVSSGHAELCWWACDAAQNITPLTKQEETLLSERSRDLDAIFPRK